MTSSASATCIGESFSALAIFSTATSCSSVSTVSPSGSTLAVARWASLRRILLTRSRRAAVARTAAAAGLLSSWVRPAESRPKDRSRSRAPIADWLLRKPTIRPSSRCIAIGNQTRTFSPKSVPSLTQPLELILLQRFEEKQRFQFSGTQSRGLVHDRLLLFGQVAMDQGDGERPLPDGGGNALD